MSKDKTMIASGVILMAAGLCVLALGGLIVGGVLLVAGAADLTVAFFMRDQEDDQEE